MQFHPDTPPSLAVTAYGPGWIAVNGKKYTSSLVIGSAGLCLAWDCTSFEDLQASHFEQLVTLDSELILFGSGSRIRFPQPQWLQALYAQRIGVETMDTPAACRTYNFLAGEGRKVVAALLL